MTCKKKKKEKYKNKASEVFMSGQLGIGYSKKEQFRKPKEWGKTL